MLQFLKIQLKVMIIAVTFRNIEDSSIHLCAGSYRNPLVLQNRRGGVLDWSFIWSCHKEGGSISHVWVNLSGRGARWWSDLCYGLRGLEVFSLRWSVCFRLLNRFGRLRSSYCAQLLWDHRNILCFGVFHWLLVRNVLPLRRWASPSCRSVLDFRWGWRCGWKGHHFELSWLLRLTDRLRWGRIWGCWGLRGLWLPRVLHRRWGLDCWLRRSWCLSWLRNSSFTVSTTLWDGQMTGRWHSMDVCPYDSGWWGAGVGI